MTEKERYDQYAISPEEMEPVSVRAYNVLKWANVLCLWQLCQMRRRDLLNARNCGKVTVDELAAYLDRLGLPHHLKRGEPCPVCGRP